VITVQVSPSSVAGLSAVSVTIPGMVSPLSVRVMESTTAVIVERLAARAHARAVRRGREPRLDLDDLVARAELIGARDLDAT
jgi:hypothetical protein